jgi:hypothetical protein
LSPGCAPPSRTARASRFDATASCGQVRVRSPWMIAVAAGSIRAAIVSSMSPMFIMAFSSPVRVVSRFYSAIRSFSRSTAAI